MTSIEAVDATNPDQPRWQQGELVEVEITDLSDSGDGVGRSDQRVVFVPDTVTGDRAIVRLLRVKPNFARAKLHQLLQPSPHRIRPRCIVADKCGGCQWQHVSDAYQRAAKYNQVVQALKRIGGLPYPPVDPVLQRGDTLSYRNKATYPLGRSLTGQVQAGYYQKHSHQLVNLNQCPIQDERLDPLLAAIKQDIAQRGWSIYNEQKHRGNLRHLGFRIGRHTGEVLLLLVACNWDLPELEQQAQIWLQRYPALTGVVLNRNPDLTNTILGSESRCIAGRPYLRERFLDLTLQIGPDTFFQVNTEQAEVLVEVVLDELALQGRETVLDAYCGIGTLTLPLAQQAQRVVGIEVQAAAIDQALQNAQINGIQNVAFEVGAVEQVLPQLEWLPDVVILDPPRRGCDAQVIQTLRQMQPARIVYVSCNPATLARDLKLLSDGQTYEVQRIQPVDLFPQTAHVECVAFLSQRQPLV